MILVFTIDKQIITRRDNEKVVRDSVNYLHVNFSFSEEWTGDKTAVFKSKSGIAYNVLVGSDGSCLVPWEVLKEEYFEVSAFCGDLITANVVKVFTIPSGYEIGSQGRIPTPDIYAQIIARLSAIEAEIDPTAIQQVVDEYLSDKDYVTEQDVEQIVSDYIEAHKDELKGDTGATGPQGPQGIQGPKGDTGEGVAAGGTTGQVLIKSSNADYDTEWESIDGIVREKVYTPVEITLEDGYVRFTDGEIRTGTGVHFEIPVISGEKYSISSQHGYYVAVYALYDSNGNFVSAYPTTAITNNILDATEVTIPDGVTMMRGSGYGDAPLKVYKITDGNYSVNSKANDILYGKKWVACGDSFTAGALNGYTDSEGHTGYESDGYDPIQGKIKTYSYFIANRTGINVDLLALGGSTFTNISGAYVPFSNDSSITNYTQIPSDADYITLAYGLNETSLTAEQIGTSADTTNETLWGAYNVVLTSILTANPSVKIGIIINDAWMSKTYHDALIEIAENWGIPYLDLKDGVEVPVMIDGRLDGKVNATAKTLRNGAFKIAANAHPTPEGHKYRSTVIENFLRSL